MITASQYLENKKRLEKAEKVLDKGNKWQNPKYQHWADAYSQILEENLEYQSFHKIS